ncbi:MAG: hypothetical protein ACOH1Y_18395 [Propionicimonas sp.]
MPPASSAVLDLTAGDLHHTWESKVHLRSLVQIGWTEADWTALMVEGLTAGAVDASTASARLVVRQWLLSPPPKFVAAVTPLTVRVTFAVHGRSTPGVLDAYAAGASERFVDAFLNGRHDRVGQEEPLDGWTCARAAHLREPAATGWALTGRLMQSSLLGRGLSLGVLARHIRLWVDRCGETAYLWVLAGFTMDEATAMLDGSVVTDEQLRVMVDLNGMALPAGI